VLYRRGGRSRVGEKEAGVIGYEVLGNLEELIWETQERRFSRSVGYLGNHLERGGGGGWNRVEGDT